MCLRYLTALSGCLLVGSALGQDIPRPEHPRPDFERANWLNLNGVWQFQIDNDEVGEEMGYTFGRDYAREILVPFCPESALSGVQVTDFMNRVWYRRMLQVPDTMRGQRLFLHFGAVDWHARVWVNGLFAGEHKGGYTPFSLEITDLVADGENELVVSATDHTSSGLQATGKQSHRLESYGCVYTRTTGIWQTVWLEAVGETYLRDCVITPDLDTGRVYIQAWLDGPQQGVTLRLSAADESGAEVATAVAPASWRSTMTMLEVEDPIRWHPGEPYLYDLTLTVERDGQVLDEVSSYFGFRKITLDGKSFLINGERVFQRLILDQGFYPEGVYTAPTEDALRLDHELSMAAGFNGARLHEKVFEPRSLYWADRLGYLIWAEYPNWGLNESNAAVGAQAMLEWREALRRDRNHPSIIGWCPLNETGAGEGQALLQAMLSVTQEIDPTRPFLDTSGYVHLYPGTDVFDSHNYNQDPASFANQLSTFALTGDDPYQNNIFDQRSHYRGQPYFVSEYGGTAISGSTSEGAWGYGSAAEDIEQFFARYAALTDVLLGNRNCFAFCYTQLTDIEQEQNGVYLYDRAPKYDVARLREINAQPAAYETQGPLTVQMVWSEVLPSSESEAQLWRYTTQAAPEGWALPEFDDSQWVEGPGGFGTTGTPGSVVRTEWATPDLWIRRQFDYTPQAFDIAMLRIHHDEDAQVYVNGQEVLAVTGGYTTSYVLMDVTDALRAALVEGVNTIAVHCHHREGGQYIDVGILLGSKGLAGD